ncbi:NAD(P)-binding protein [Daedaleopsis nitida]|nr:NAD(P)-binding protein [Daedaleopsis nitida]
MAPVKNGRLLFNEIPDGYPEPGKTTVYDESQTIDIDGTPLDGGFLLKTLVLSIDPYMRGRMRDPSVKSYIDPFALGQPLVNFGVGVVLRSEDPDIKAGDHLYGMYPFQHYVIQKNAKLFRKVKSKPNVPWSAYVGVCGMPGQTAYYAWKEYANPQKHSTATKTSFLRTVVQLAKADGMKVIASSGSDEKATFVSSIGADVSFNYKLVDTRKILEKEGPINVYWDNVGGSTLEATIDNAARGARFIECGMISGYNTKEPYGIKNLMRIVAFELHIHGFIVSSLAHKYSDEFYSTFVERVSRGEIKYNEHLVRGLENSGEGILDVQTGKNFGKCVVVVADE